jgi:hypothetical protein
LFDGSRVRRLKIWGGFNLFERQNPSDFIEPCSFVYFFNPGKIALERLFSASQTREPAVRFMPNLPGIIDKGESRSRKRSSINLGHLSNKLKNEQQFFTQAAKY